MTHPEWSNYLNELTAQVKFTIDHNDIKREYREHMEDKLEFLMDCGMEEERAAKTVLEEMGDPVSLGKELNKIHNPLVGWTCFVVKMVAIIITVAFIFFYGMSLIVLGFSKIEDIFVSYPMYRDDGTIVQIHGEEIFRYEVDETFECDGAQLYIKELRRYEDGTAVLWYKTITPKIIGRGQIRELDLVNRYLYDENGNSVFSNNTESRNDGGLNIKKACIIINKLPGTTKQLVLDYETGAVDIELRMPLGGEVQP